MCAHAWFAWKQRYLCHCITITIQKFNFLKPNNLSHKLICWKFQITWFSATRTDVPMFSRSITCSATGPVYVAKCFRNRRENCDISSESDFYRNRSVLITENIKKKMLTFNELSFVSTRPISWNGISII